VSSVLIVEGPNDQFFVEALIKHETKYRTNIKPIYKFESMSGLSQLKLQLTLENIAAQMDLKGKFQKIGILIDQDDKTNAERLTLISQAIAAAFPNAPTLKAINQFVPLNDDLQIGCCLTHVEGKGELETLLRAIHTQKAPYADCLESWRSCVEEADPNLKIAQKEIDKLWINNYHRYDTCDLKERKNAGKYCSFKAAMQKDIYDWDHPALADIKQFLTQLTAD
jgi:hypothetical protein